MSAERQSKATRVDEVVFAEMMRHAANPEEALPTDNRFVFYGCEQRGEAQKPHPDDLRPNRRRSVGWPPGSQDITDAMTRLRNEGTIPWDWIVDTERNLIEFDSALTVTEYMRDRLPEARINPWGAEPPPLVLTEANGMAAALTRVAYEFVCPVAGLKGQANGFVRTVLARLFAGNRRQVLFVGDWDRSGRSIEANAKRVLEDATGREVGWTRIALTETQTEGIEPIWKVDGRDRVRVSQPAWEVEALGQATVVALVRAALDARLPEPLARVLEREDAQRRQLRAQLW